MISVLVGEPPPPLPRTINQDPAARSLEFGANMGADLGVEFAASC